LQSQFCNSGFEIAVLKCWICDRSLEISDLK
jgi:hypothetical protein